VQSCGQYHGDGDESDNAVPVAGRGFVLGMRNAKWALSFALAGFLLFHGMGARADTFRLSDGTVIICKIIEETDTHYVIANSYGTFTVMKKNVKEKYETRSYKEDVKIQLKLNIKVDEEKIKRNIEDGIKKKKEREEETSLKMISKRKPLKDYGTREPGWFFGRIGFSAAYYAMVTGGLMNKVPGGMTLQVTYDQGLEGLFRKGHMGIPGIRFEAGYLDFERAVFCKSNQRLTGYFAQAGPAWLVPAYKNSWGSLLLAGLPGAGYFDAINRDLPRRRSGVHFLMTLLAGYEYHVKEFSLSAQVRYMYIMDSGLPVHAVGGSVGFSYRLWSSPILK